MNPHPYRLRAYHNPENVPFSAIPSGWRFLYADEVGRPQNKPCRMWINIVCNFSRRTDSRGIFTNLTYIVPINA